MVGGGRVLSLKFSQVFEEDLELLRHDGWLNDRLIAFWFEVLESRFPDSRLLLVDPSAAYWWLMEEHAEELHTGMDAVDMLRKQVVAIPVNDHACKATAGGTHWSLLLWVRGLCLTTPLQHSPSPSDSSSAASASAILCDRSSNSATASPETANSSFDKTMTSVDAAGDKDCAAAIECRMLVEGKFWHLDSMRGPTAGNRSRQNAEEIARKLVDYVRSKQKEHGLTGPPAEKDQAGEQRPESRARRKGATAGRTTEASCAQQTNSSDCGVFVLLYAERLVNAMKKLGGSGSVCTPSDAEASRDSRDGHSCCEACGSGHGGRGETCPTTKLVKLAGQVSGPDESQKLRTRMRVTVMREAEKRGIKF